MESSTIAAILLGSMAGGILADWHVLAALASARWCTAGRWWLTCGSRSCRRRVRGSRGVFADDPQLL
jgi:hypothetical protein